VIFDRRINHRYRLPHISRQGYWNSVLARPGRTWPTTGTPTRTGSRSGAGCRWTRMAAACPRAAHRSGAPARGGDPAARAGGLPPGAGRAGRPADPGGFFFNAQGLVLRAGAG